MNKIGKLVTPARSIHLQTHNIIVSCTSDSVTLMHKHAHTHIFIMCNTVHFLHGPNPVVKMTIPCKYAETYYVHIIVCYLHIL